MLRLALTPRWLALHVLLLVVLVAFVRLGIWQYDSYRAQRGVGVVAAAVPLSSVAGPGQALRRDGVAVRSVGRYDAAAQLVVAGVRVGGRSGFAVLTPLRVDGGGVLVVLRGWAPDASLREVPAGEVVVTGVLVANDPDIGERTDATTPAGHVVTAISTEELLRGLPYGPDRLYDGHVVLTAQAPASPLTPIPVRRHHGGVSAWRNLAYALQWWFFAAAAIWLWGVSLRTAARSVVTGSDARG